jgi:glycosyltransferase involved in cell wall biosynthesis
VAYWSERVLLQRDFDFILAMGSQGAEWFRNCGYSGETVFPYAYITEKPAPCERQRVDSPDFRLLFVGQLIHRKGIDVLLRALAGLKGVNWRLDAVGGGKEENTLRRLAAVSGIDERVDFAGPVAYSRIGEYMSRADLLVLPSRFDGWGAVVNEALMAGLPAICSDRCGARDIVQASRSGSVFRSESVESLAKALAAAISKGKRTFELTEKTRCWSERLEGPCGARYVLAVMEHVYRGGPTPVPIWD